MAVSAHDGFINVVTNGSRISVEEVGFGDKMS